MAVYRRARDKDEEDGAEKVMCTPCVARSQSRGSEMGSNGVRRETLGAGGGRMYLAGEG